ncbi:unnamed protein product [Acanthoscelides obtectus]|uniref:Uncharacterized protein n=1 Tax=Acanthoscelides obtectus TaxID=200917 RepID=A0A9P0PYN6_ACAOB
MHSTANMLFSILFVTFKFLCLCQGFKIPSIKLEAFKPSGFRASLRAESGIERFAFHGNKNKEISMNEPGEFSAEVRYTGGEWVVYDDSDVSLSVGDVVHYWVFVQHERMGYRKDAQNWTVDELKDKNGCDRAITILESRKDVCVGDSIIDEEFQDLTDNDKWQIDHYIPVEPDYEFVVYKRDPDVVYTKNGTLVIKPKIVESMNREIDLRNGCTKSSVKAQESMCYQAKETRRDIKIVSGRITSKVAFSYGEVVIKAKLPFGDWIYPEIFLEEADDTKSFNKRIIIAYSRGNLHFSGSDGVNIGCFLLFGGPVASAYEPEKSRMLSSYHSNDKPFSDKFREYRLTWNPDRIELFVDDTKYGSIESTAIRNEEFTVNPMKV